MKLRRLDPNLAVKTRMTDVQIKWFLENYRIVDHLPNQRSGFSATLFQKLDAGGEHVLSFRSTESKFGEFDVEGDQGGDWARDGAPGADGEISESGFPFGQMNDAEAYLEHLKNGETYDQDLDIWVASNRLNEIKQHLERGGELNITGYSLGDDTLADAVQSFIANANNPSAFTASRNLRTHSHRSRFYVPRQRE